MIPLKIDPEQYMARRPGISPAGQEFYKPERMEDIEEIMQFITGRCRPMLLLDRDSCICGRAGAGLSENRGF